MKIAVLGSTNGTSLQGIIDACLTGILSDITIELVCSNKQDAYILTRASMQGIKAIYRDPTGISRKEYDKQLTKLFLEHDIDLILLIGYMKILSAEFVETWRNKVMNIHPSLLPAFAGKIDSNIHSQILKRGCAITGASLIFIDQGADTGPIISQKAVPVLDHDTVDTLKSRVQSAEQELLIQALLDYSQDKIKVRGNKVLIL